MQEILLFPIHFKSAITKDVIIDENRLKLRRITENEILHFFNIRVKERREDGLIKSFNPTKDFNILYDPFSALLMNERRAHVVS